jgi:hypothetical protein
MIYPKSRRFGISNYPALILILLIVMLSSYRIPIPDAFAMSPPFARQVITDVPHDWDASPLDDISNCTGIQHYITYPDLEAISYFSDGKTLNATLWLSAPFEEKPFGHVPSYSMYIHINSFYESTQPDYEVTVFWDIDSHNWTRDVIELSSNDSRIVSETRNFTNFFDNNPEAGGKAKGRVTLNFNLQSINSPDSYIGFFSLEDRFSKNENQCLIVDDSDNAIYVPIPEFTVSTMPNSVELRPGDVKDVQLRVNSSIHSSPRITFSTNQSSGIEVNLVPKQEFLTPAAMTTSFLHLKALTNATYRYNAPYTIRILPNASFPKIGSTLLRGKSTINQMSATIPLKTAYLTVTILPPIGPLDAIKDTFVSWTPITAFYPIAAAVVGISLWVFAKIRKKRENKGSWEEYE